MYLTGEHTQSGTVVTQTPHNQVADKLTGNLDVSQYWDFVFGMLFLKRASDVFEEHCHTLALRHYKVFPFQAEMNDLEEHSTLSDR